MWVSQRYAFKLLALPTRHDSAAENCNEPFAGVTVKLEGDVKIAPCSFATEFRTAYKHTDRKTLFLSCHT